LNNTLGVTQFYGGTANSSGTVIGGTQDNGTLLWTEASGTSWSETLGSDGGFVAADPVDGSFLYSETIYLSLYRKDGGGDWTYIADGISDAGRNANFVAPFVLDPSTPQRMLAGGASLWRSDNVRSTPPAWKAVLGPGSAGDYISAIAVAPASSDIVWV